MDYKLETIDYFSDGHKGLYDGITQLTKSINNTYPGHNDWLYKKFFPGLKDGSRKIVVAYNDLNNPMGVARLPYFSYLCQRK
jgi:regulator of sigma D